jgi:tetratricopeptide (TPR) repeat protein
MTRWNHSTRLALLVIGSLATSAAAQPAAAPNKQPTQQQIDSSRPHFKAAEAAMKRRDYQTAVTEYLAANQLWPNAEFVFDVGEAYRLAGDEPNALIYYQKYLDLEPGGRGAAAAHAAIDELRRSIAAKPPTMAQIPPPRTAPAPPAARRAAEVEAGRKAADDARPKTDEDAARRAADDDAARKAADDTRPKVDEDAARRADEDAARRAAEDAAGRQPPASSSSAPPAAPAHTARAWYRDPVAVGLLGAGVAATAVGIGFLVSAQSADQDARSAGTYQGVLDAGDRASQRGTLGSITTGVGIALVGGGVVWIVLHRSAGEQRTVTGWLVPGGGGLMAQGRF